MGKIVWQGIGESAKGMNAMTEEQRCQTPEIRFWSKVDKTPGLGPDGDCWLWRGGVSTSGYGHFGVGYRQYSAHRFSFYLSHQDLPVEMCVCHRCDVKICVNPHHLFLGSLADNNRDMAIKGRQAAGDRHPSRTRPECLARGDRSGARTHPERKARGEQTNSAKLTVVEVLELRRVRQEVGMSYARLAARFGISQTQARRVAQRQSWAHIQRDGAIGEERTFPRSADPRKSKG